MRRVSNGSSPTFKLTLPTVEWINEDRRWQQIERLWDRRARNYVEVVTTTENTLWGRAVWQAMQRACPTRFLRKIGCTCSLKNRS